MSPPASLRIVAGSLMLTGLLGSAAWGYVHRINSNTGLPYKWPATEYPLRVMLGTTPVLSDGTNFNTTFEAAAQAWNNVMGGTRFVVTFAPPSVPSANEVNEVVLATMVEGMEFPSGALAVTLSRPGSSNRIAEADIYFNAARTFDSYRGAPRPTPEIRRIAVHELGHALGLLHPNEAGQSVTAIMNAGAANLETPRADDIAGAQALYGPPGLPDNDHFRNARALTLGGDNRTSATGHNTNATAEAGEPAHAGLPGGRSVWWRWTAPAAGFAVADTRGSLFDTTLGAYTGDSVSALVRRADSDDIQRGVVQASELMFLVAAGTTYRLAVDGFNPVELSPTDTTGAESGSIRLNLRFSNEAVVAPVITAHPASQSVQVGAEVTFNVTATGTEPLAYEWQFNAQPGRAYGSSELRISEVGTMAAGTYRVIVSNAAGSVTSNDAMLTVSSPPPPPPPASPPSSGGGGGGGAPSVWFAGALLLVVACRWAAGGTKRLEWNRR